MRSKNLLPHNQNDKKKKVDGFFSHHTQRFMDMWNWEYHVKLNKARWNRQTYHIFGIETEDFEITWESVFAYVHMHDKKYTAIVFKKQLMKNENSILNTVLSERMGRNVSSFSVQKLFLVRTEKLNVFSERFKILQK